MVRIQSYLTQPLILESSLLNIPALEAAPTKSAGQQAISEAFISFLSGVPVVIWVALIALLGVVIGHVLTQIQFYLRTKHETKLKHRESLTAFQKEVYLKAAEVIAEAVSILMKISTKSLAEVDVEMNKLQLGPTLNKINMIGSNETIGKISNFSENFSGLILEICGDIVQHERYNYRTQSLSTQIDACLDQLKSINSQISTISADKRNEAYSLDLFAQFDEVQAKFYSFMSERDSIWKLVKDANVARLRFVLSSYEPLSCDLIEANIAIRKEMEFDFDEGAYRERSRAIYLRGKVRLEKFINQIDAEAEKIGLDQIAR